MARDNAALARSGGISGAGAQTAPPLAGLARPETRRGSGSTVRAAAGASGDSDADERPAARSERRSGAAAGAAAQAQPRTAPAVDIQLFRNPAQSAAEPAVLAAWTALRDGHLDDARARYLSLEPGLSGNVDIQLGLARIAAEQGQTAEARQRYQRALVLDPLNRTAQAGLAVLEPAARDSHLDSQLRASAAAHEPLAQFALAARLSAAGQWPEAEQAWFEAVRADPDNPDLLFNLAVALDHLGQTPAARRHYQDALQASGSRSAHFDRAALETRLRALAGE
jgi:tetratricopeptide (TPR) repeat protein